MEDDLDEAANEQAEADFEDLMGKGLDEILREGQKALFARLVTRCRAGLASHQELAILRNVLKDNGLTLGIAPEQPTTYQPPADLPEFETPDYLN